MHEFQVTGHDSFHCLAADIVSVTETCTAVVNGLLQAAYICGPPGIGKNMAVRAALDRAGITDPVKANPRNYLDLLKAIDAARSRGGPVWFDEADVLWRSDRMLNVLKIATSDHARDRVYNRAFIGVPIIVTTNVNLAPPWPSRAAADNCPALFNRSPPIMIRATPEEIVAYAIHLAKTTAMVGNDWKGDGIALAVRERAYDWFRANADRLREPSPRALKNAANLMNRNKRGDVSEVMLDRSLAAMLE